MSQPVAKKNIGGEHLWSMMVFYFFPEMVWYMMTTIVGRDFCSQHGSLILFDTTDPINVGLIDVLKWKLRKHISMGNHGELYVQTTKNSWSY
jgi:hypothetical protein